MDDPLALDPETMRATGYRMREVPAVDAAIRRAASERLAIS